MDRDEAIARIRQALKARSGLAWSVKGGRGTAWGWITIDAPPARRTWSYVPGQTDPASGRPTYDEVDRAARGGHMGPTDRAALAAVLGLTEVHHQGVSIPASTAYYVEYVDRAEGRPPSRVGTPYWD